MPKDPGPQSGPTAADQSVTGPDTATTTAAEPTATAGAATTGGPKLIRCLHPGDRFVFDPKANAGDADAGAVTGTYRQFPATQAKDVIAAAAASGVRVLVADTDGSR